MRVVKPDSLTVPDDEITEEKLLDNEFKEHNLDYRREPSIRKQIQVYYSIIKELPSEIECPHCLKSIILDSNEIEKRILTCCECYKKIDFTYDSKLASFFDIESEKLEKPKISYWHKIQVRGMQVEIKKYRKKETLPNKISCPYCFNKIELSDEQKNSRFFKCNNCKDEFDFSYIGK